MYEYLISMFNTDKEKILFFAVEDFTFFIFRTYLTTGGSQCRKIIDVQLLPRALEAPVHCILLLPPDI